MSNDNPILEALKAAGIQSDNARQIGMDLGNAVARLQRGITDAAKFDAELKNSLLSDYRSAGVTDTNVDDLVKAVHAEHKARNPTMLGTAGSWNQRY